MRLFLALVALLIAFPATAEKRIAISFDDVPRMPGAFFETSDKRTAALIAALKRAKVKQAGFFVTTGNLDKPHGVGGEARIAAYVKAGHVIANHSHSHQWLSRMTAADYLADVDKAELWLKGRPGYRPWFRYPFLGEQGTGVEQRDAVRAGLRERGLKNAYVTVDNYDWHLENLASNARRDGKKMDMDALRKLYVETMVLTANHYEAIAQEVLNRSPIHVLLLHETDLNAMYIADLVNALRKDGWSIATMDEAYRDPIAATEPNTLFLGEGRIAALGYLAGMKPGRLVHERTDEDVLAKLFSQRVLKEANTP
jgi:peptidoglycan-N-acetylglucosamine deacetylase